MYEVAKPQQAVNSAAKLVFQKCSDISGHSTVTAIPSKRRVAFLGGSPKGFYRCRRVAFSFVDLLLAFAANLFMPFCALGDVVFQLNALPIGGMLSKIAASFTLACEEHAWCFDICRRQLRGFSRDGRSWDSEVARGRYVDDVIWVCAVYCHACLGFGLSLVYTSVSFEVDAESRVATWLDLRFDASQLCWSMKSTKWTFRLLGVRRLATVVASSAVVSKGGARCE